MFSFLQLLAVHILIKNINLFWTLAASEQFFINSQTVQILFLIRHPEHWTVCSNNMKRNSSLCTQLLFNNYQNGLINIRARDLCKTNVAILIISWVEHLVASLVPLVC